MSEAMKGALAMIGACTIWGLSPFYYRLVIDIPPPEILAHRTIWSLVFFLIVLAIQHRLPEIGRALSGRRRLVRTALAALMISANWGVFIYSISVARVAESSLGYYIFPIVSVLFGLVIFRERPAALQWVAIALALAAVAALTLDLGRLPWISLTLAVTFAIYGTLKKGTEAGPVASVTTEVIILLPLALLWLALMTDGLPGVWALAILIASGPLTGIPLMLFSYAARRIGLVSLGLIQYLNPSLQALSAVILGEMLGRAHAIAFALIWTALALYSFDAAKRERASTRASASGVTRT